MSINAKGKVVKQRAGGTKFDIRMVPKYKTDSKTGKSTMESLSYQIYIGKNSVKTGFKSIKAAEEFVVENQSKYDKESKKFK